MTDVALIKSGTIAQVWRDTTEQALSAEGVTGDLVEFSPGEAVCGMVWDGTALTFPAAPIPTIFDLNAYASEKRYIVETGGIVLNGLPVRTDRGTQGMLSRVVQLLDRGTLTPPLNIKTPAGQLSLTAEQIGAIGDAVALHVQAAFDVEATVSSQIASGAITTFAEIDAAAWPSNT